MSDIVLDDLPNAGFRNDGVAEGRRNLLTSRANLYPGKWVSAVSFPNDDNGRKQAHRYENNRPVLRKIGYQLAIRTLDNQIHVFVKLG